MAFLSLRRVSAALCPPKEGAHLSLLFDDFLGISRDHGVTAGYLLGIPNQRFLLPRVPSSTGVFMWAPAPPLRRAGLPPLNYRSAVDELGDAEVFEVFDSEHPRSRIVRRPRDAGVDGAVRDSHTVPGWMRVAAYRAEAK